MNIPPCGYKTVKALAKIKEESFVCDAPPVVENAHYRIAFAKDGSMRSIFDKALGRELLDEAGGANRFVYTEDHHKSFVSPTNAVFTVTSHGDVITVKASADEPCSCAHIEQTAQTLEIRLGQITLKDASLGRKCPG